MKIDQNVIALNSATQADGPARARTAPAPEAPTGPAASVTMRLPALSGDFDAARVANIRDAIAAGRYEVDAGRIADGLLDQVQQLLRDRK